MNPHHSSKSNEHYTPPHIIEAARETMGGIDLDPASCLKANEIVKAKKFFTKDDDGLSEKWHGRVFLNPPGGAGSAKEWWQKLIKEWAEGRVCQAIFLAFSIELLQTAQVGAWPDDWLPTDFPICYPSRRIAFIDESGKPKKGNTHASCIVYVTPIKASCGGFVGAFEKIGRCVIPKEYA